MNLSPVTPKIVGNGEGHIGFLVETWDEPQDNLPILKDFGLEDGQELPLFVAFMWDDKDNLNAVTMPIRGNDIDSTYHSIKEIVKTISSAEAAILPEYKGTVNVFREVKGSLEGLDFKYKAKSFGRITNRIKELLEMFK